MTTSHIYLDFAAATPMHPEVLKAMTPYFTEIYGNAGSAHQSGLDAKMAMDQARNDIADFLNCNFNEIIFTGSATEANNLAIFGAARANENRGTHLITTEVEHSSVYEVFKKLEKEGFQVTYLKVDENGFVSPDELKKNLTKETILCSIIYANNEIGTIQDIPKLAEICHQNNTIFHTDACQAANYLSLDTKKLGIDLLTINGSKIYGPKGIGVLFAKKEIKIEPLIFGGKHEMGLRSGTENIPLIVGMAKALELANQNKEKEISKLKKLQNYLIEGVLKIKGTKINGPFGSLIDHRLPNNISVVIPGIEGKEMLLLLDSKGICCSTGSTCDSNKNTGKSKGSHVLRAIGKSEEEASSSLRFSLGHSTTKQEIDYLLRTLTQIICQKY